jgi:tetratricopeptide (TPR) repeat protein
MTSVHPARSPFRRAALALAIAAACAAPARAGPVDDAVADLQSEWATIKYKVPAKQQEARYADLAAKARAASRSWPDRADVLIWEGIIVSSLAGAKGGLGALGLAKDAKALYEDAIRLSPDALDGSAYNSLGVLYYKVPGWPLGFGDKARAQELLQKALAINPRGLDPNYFYGEYLVETGKPADAVAYLERALQAPPRPGRETADAGRREEAQHLLDKARAAAR